MRIEILENDEPSFILRYPHHIATRRGPAQPWGLVFGPVSAIAAGADRFCIGFPADEFPAFERLVQGETADLWVGPFIQEGETPVMKPLPLQETTWSVYDGDGRWVADVVLPARFRLFSAGRD